MNENELKKFDWKNPPTYRLSRKKEVQKNYDNTIGTQKHYDFVEKIKQKLEQEHIVFEPNEYPYDVRPMIKHSCLWYNGDLTPDDVINYLISKNIYYITFFENDMKNRSIKTIRHYHIFHY